MNRLISISHFDEIPLEYRDTPIGLLLEYHNLNRSLDNYLQARLLIGMCMDNFDSQTILHISSVQVERIFNTVSSKCHMLSRLEVLML